MLPAIKKGTICLVHKSFKHDVKRSKQELEVRKVTDDGKRVVVHQKIFPTGMVSTVEIKDILILDGDYWYPCPVERKKTSTPVEKDA